MIHPDTQLRHINHSIGYGVFATRPIPAGTITWVQDPLDQVFEPHQVERLAAIYQGVVERYTWRNERGQRILCWDFGRYMNHSCDANTFSAGPMFEIAIRNIEPDEQLTSDYGALNLEASMICQCGSSRCRGIVRNEDFDALAAEWDRKIRQAFPQIACVEQPLWPYLPETRTIEDGLADPAKAPSIMLHRFAPQRLPHDGFYRQARAL